MMLGTMEKIDFLFLVMFGGGKDKVVMANGRRVA